MNLGRWIQNFIKSNPKRSPLRARAGRRKYVMPKRLARAMDRVRRLSRRRNRA